MMVDKSMDARASLIGSRTIVQGLALSCRVPEGGSVQDFYSLPFIYKSDP